MNLSEKEEFSRLLGRIGNGMRLRVPHGPAWAQLVKDPRGFPDAGESEPVATKMVRYLIRSGTLWKMVEDRTGDSKSWRMGWRESGMDGDVADWYVSLI